MMIRFESVYKSLTNKKMRNPNARICANCVHWFSDEHEKWGYCDVAIKTGWFTNHPKGRKPYLCHHSNNRYRSQKACKKRFEFRGDRLAEKDEIQYYKDRIAWIDEHEKMFEISYCMMLEREYCKEKLKELTKNKE